MKDAFLNLSVLVCLVACVARAEGPFEDGLRPTQLVQIVHMLPPTPISSIRFFREENNGRLSAAVLTGNKKRGWEILLISPQGRDAYHTSWTSPKLPISFEMSSPTNLKTYGVADEEAIVFSGCARHMCPEIFSALLYVPTRHRAFVGTCNNGQMTYSFTPEAALQGYKTALNEILQEIDKHGSGHACSSEIREQR